MDSMRYIGVIGSGRFVEKDIVISFLERFIDESDVIVSGHSPRNNYDNVDIWAERWAEENCNNPPIIERPSEFTKAGFFGRNKKIADRSDILIAFIPSRQYRSGAWNTIKYFLESHDYTSLLIIDESGKKWNRRDLPNWVKQKITETSRRHRRDTGRNLSKFV